MWSLLDKPTVHNGLVLYRGPIGPPVEQILGLAAAAHDPGMQASRDPPQGESWAVRLTHPAWGEAVVSAPRDPAWPSAEIIRFGTPGLTDGEREAIGSSGTVLLVQATSPERDVRKARKHLLRWLRRLMSLDGLVAVDLGSELFWSRAMLDDELAHDADLDVEALFTVHLIYDGQTPEQRAFWMHTHGLEALGAFDIDVLRPSVALARNAGDCMRSLAFAALEGQISPSASGFVLGQPGGKVDFVPVQTFDAQAAAADAKIRHPEPPHAGRRAVVCEPRGIFGFLRSKPIPSRFLERLDGDVVFNFSLEASALMAARARATLNVFKALIAEFDPASVNGLVKIGYVTASDPTSREHLWFEVHGFDGDRVDATLLNQPFDVPALEQQARGWHSVADLSDWVVMSPAGPMTPRSLSAARRLRERPG